MRAQRRLAHCRTGQWRWAAAAFALLCGQGCAILATSRAESRIEIGQPVESERLSALQEPPTPELTVQVDSLRVQVQLAAVRRCVAQQVRARPRVERQWTGYPRWAWSLPAMEATAGLTAWQFGLNAADTGAESWAWTGAVAVLLGAAVVDGWRLASQGNKALVVPLPPQEDFGSWRLVHCGSEPVASGEIAVRGGRADWYVAVDASGGATIAVDELPARSFPYQRPLADVTCTGCASVPLTLDAGAAAQLVMARQDLEDLETWLSLHPGHPGAPQVAAARQNIVRVQKSEREQARRSAEKALEVGDLASAAQAVRRCQDAARTPAPACDQLGRLVDERFVALQLDQGRRALARGAVAEAEAALYRCTLVERNRPGCLELENLIAAARQQAIAAAQELAQQRIRARDAGLWLAVHRRCRSGSKSACKASVERCLSVNPDHELCLQKRGAMVKRRHSR